MENVERYPWESQLDYLVRLFDNKQEYHLNCEQIARLINEEFGNSFGESAYRKFYKAFNEGRQYEREAHHQSRHLRILSVSDFHIPFQVPISTFQRYAGKVDLLQINGDVLDCASISKFPKSFRSSVMDDIIAARQYLIELIELLNPAHVVCNYGNHDARLENYLTKKLDCDLVELLPRTPLELIFQDGFSHYDKSMRAKTWYSPLTDVFQNIVIEYHDSWYSQVGKTIFCHPLSYKGGAMRTAEAAVRFFQNIGAEFDCLVMGHTHHIGNYMCGKTLLFEQGACCQVDKLHYADGKLTVPQNQGFLYLEQSEDGSLANFEQEFVK